MPYRKSAIRRLPTQVFFVPAIIAALIQLYFKLSITCIRGHPSFLIPEKLAGKQVIFPPAVSMRCVDPQAIVRRWLIVSTVISTITWDHVKMPSSSTSAVLFALFYIFLVANLAHSSKSCLRAKLMPLRFLVVHKIFSCLVDALILVRVLSLVRSFVPMLKLAIRNALRALCTTRVVL